MRHIRPFRDMASAPRDGRIVEICDGAKGKIALVTGTGSCKNGLTMITTAHCTNYYILLWFGGRSIRCMVPG